MKKLFMLATVLGLISTNILAYNYGYDPSVYEAEEQARAYQVQQQQLQLYYQQLAYQNQARVQQVLDQTIQNDLADGKIDLDVTRQFVQQNSPSKSTQPTSLVPIYEQQYENAMAAYKSQYVLENPDKVKPYIEKQIQIESQDAIKGAQSQAKMNDLYRQSQYNSAYAAYIKDKCHNVTSSPADAVTCSRVYLEDAQYYRGKARYNREKVLKSWLNI